MESNSDLRSSSGSRLLIPGGKGRKMNQTIQSTVNWKIITYGVLPPCSCMPVWFSIEFIVP